jgi:hypothetical protein
VFPCFAVPRSIIRSQRVKCSSATLRARATCTARTYSACRIIDLPCLCCQHLAWQHQSPRSPLLSTSGRCTIYRDGWNPSHPRRGPIAPPKASGGHWPRHAPTRIGKPFTATPVCPCFAPSTPIPAPWIRRLLRRQTHNAQGSTTGTGPSGPPRSQ